MTTSNDRVYIADSPRPLPERFMARVKRAADDVCWEWLGPRRGTYGRMKHAGKTWPAHRISWLVHFGEIPDGLMVCHKCDNRLCVNPNHLFLGTGQDNTRDRENKGRTCRGEKTPWARLTRSDVLKIRAAVGKSALELGRIYGVAPSHIQNIRKGKKWKSVL